MSTMEEQRVSENEKRTQRDYSLPFKMQIILEVEKGELTYREAQRKYGIQGRSTVLVWLRKHGSLEWQNDNPMKGKQSPQAQIRELEKKVKRLQMQNDILNTAVEVADKQLGTDIRKKYLDLLLKNTEQQVEKDTPLA
jgi:transposase-like protein